MEKAEVLPKLKEVPLFHVSPAIVLMPQHALCAFLVHVNKWWEHLDLTELIDFMSALEIRGNPL